MTLASLHCPPGRGLWGRLLHCPLCRRKAECLRLWDFIRLAWERQWVAPFFHRLRVHPLVITLGTMAIYRGVAFAMTKAQAFTHFPTEFTDRLIRLFAHVGCHQLQINTSNGETLKDAKRHPERHKKLVVRVWGWGGRNRRRKPGS